jgi:RNA polymerase sigma-70 factor (ECF subfamily)
MDQRDEFMKLFLKHQLDIKAFIGSMILDRDLRDDVFQEVALVLWEKIDTYDPERSFGAWARGVAAKKVMQTREKQARIFNFGQVSLLCPK